jgi:hypothetical protein
MQPRQGLREDVVNQFIFSYAGILITIFYVPVFKAISVNVLILLIAIFGPKRDEVTGEWGKLHNEELNDQYSSLNIVRTIKSRRMREAGHVACMEERRGVYRVLVGT